MKNSFLKAIFFLFFIFFSFSCKKNEPLIVGEWYNELLEFGITGQLYPVLKSDSSKTLLSVVAANTNKTQLSTFFTLSPEAQILYNGLTPIGNQSMKFDFSQNVQLIVKSKFNQKSTNWTLTVRSEPEVLGMGTNQTSSQSLNRNYNFYYDQKGTGNFSSINCGPSVTTMAAKWADSTYSQLPQDARNTIRSTGGWWYTNDIVNFLNGKGINPQIIRLNDIKTNIKNCIDHNYIVILCLDMYYVEFNLNSNQQTNKFYLTNSKDWGHFILIKGYKEVDGNFYLETYDPYSWGNTFFLNKELKGKNRYYLDRFIKPATDIWWPYAIVIPAKGQNVVFSDGNTKVVNSYVAPQKGF